MASVLACFHRLGNDH